MSALVLLDRDGVINVDRPEGITKMDAMQLERGAAEGLSALRQAGFKLAVVTNQSVVGKGLISLDELDALHRHLQALLSACQVTLDAIYVCTDHPDRPGPNRKPNPGMLLQALQDFNAQPAHTPMVGDALRDLQAAFHAGCARHLVRSGKGTQTLADGAALAPLQPVAVHDDLRAFSDHWLQSPRCPA